MSDRPWKRQERQLAKILGGKRIVPAEGGMGKRRHDVHVHDLPFLRPDSKLYKNLAHHHTFLDVEAAVKKSKRKEEPAMATPAKGKKQVVTMLREIEEKYCEKDGDVAVLGTKEFRKRVTLITVRAAFFKRLLDAYRSVCKLTPAPIFLASLPDRAIEARFPEAYYDKKRKGYVIPPKPSE